MSAMQEDEMLTSDSVPNDAKLIVLILKSMGIVNYEPAVVLQLLEFTHRYTTEVLTDAMQYSAHAENKQTIDLDDLKLAIQARVNTSFTPAPSREMMNSLSIAKNSLPLPLPPKYAGAILPPPEMRLAAPNWQIGIGNPTPTATASSSTTASTTTTGAASSTAPSSTTKQHRMRINISAPPQQ